MAKIIELNPSEWNSLLPFIKKSIKKLTAEHRPDGFNIGINSGEEAGQTVPHLHIHLIPRYAGDVENPRGGIRNFKKPLIEY